MSVDMNSQASDSNEEDFGVNSEEEDDDGGDDDDEEDQGDIADYYDGVAGDVEQQGADSFDPEEDLFTCLTYRESQRVLTEEVDNVAAALKVRGMPVIPSYSTVKSSLQVYKCVYILYTWCLSYK